MLYRTPGPFILVVDDDVDIRTTLVMVLQEEGYRAVGVRHGLEALKFLTECGKFEHWPAVVFLDGQMPVLTGYELLDVLKSLERAGPMLAKMPIYLITAVSNPPFPEGIHIPILRKPICLDKLLDIVRHRCGKLNGYHP